jgi:hypothetical protein
MSTRQPPGDGNFPDISASDNAATDGSGTSGVRIARHQKENPT